MLHRVCGSGALLVIACAATFAAGPAGVEQRGQTPHTAVDRLLAADRAFSAASAKTDAVAGVSAMFADNVTMPVAGGTFANGLAAVRAALRANPDHARSRLEWTPIRAGISGDGRHGFTFGYLTQRFADGREVGGKYVSYWMHTPRGWRVFAYRKRPRPAGPVSLAVMPPALPAALTTATPDAATLARYHESLDRTERAFSTEAQRLGLGPAFAKYGAADAVNMGGPDDAGFVVGAEAIGRSIGASAPAPGSPVSWGPDRVVVASSGDLGITFGMIRQNAPGPEGKVAPSVPFFTIWRRATIHDPWRYVAE